MASRIQGIKSIFSTTLDALKNALDIFLGLLGADWQTVWTAISTVNFSTL